ncbi:Na+/H+ antiporter [Sporomusa sp.]|uniref:Na+/H+ antiporter n=1 Tax=Sporomusa sp. TaxID=2078658 RepID=UPI002CF9EEFE|nr:Na+/H+ antiporter [Sporomusa sp.]HWR05849.1 Na+/H+ antiporter [Sporomusa sp.]
MELFLAILVLLCLIGLSNILNRFIPFVPVPLIQIALGATVAYLPTGILLPLNPELFFVLFIAPLLFADGKRMPREQLWNLRLPILLLALGLVFVTVFVMGYAIHWLIPSIPLPAAFALAAILSPTDAVAVGAIAGRSALPPGLMHLLEGEALMNDASGLVAFKFAVAAAVTGFFSLAQASTSFLFISIGGLFSGILLSFFMIRLRLTIRRLGMEDVTMHMLIQIVTPFVIYLFAEEVGVSGILAVVAGGIIHAIERDHAESMMAKLQVVSVSTWSVILFILNGIVFLILGLQIPDVTTVIFRDAAISNTQVIIYIIAISFGLILLRFIWNYLFWKEKWISSKTVLHFSRLHSVILISLSGVRGAVTLAGAFSIPYVLQDGSPFPERALIIFLAAGVILFTLAAASIMLPILAAKGVSSIVADQAAVEYTARKEIIRAVIQVLKEEMNYENKAATLSVIAYYDKLMKLPQNESKYLSDPQPPGQEAAIRIVGLRAEQTEAERLLKTGQISQATAYSLQKHINAAETALSNRLQFKIFLLSVLVKQSIAKLVSRNNKALKEEVQEYKFAKIQTSSAAITAIKEQMSEETKQLSLDLIANYHKSIERLSTKRQNPQKRALFEKQKKELQLKAIQVERNVVQSLFESGEISRDIANKLRRSTNYFEATILDDDLNS